MFFVLFSLFIESMIDLTVGPLAAKISSSHVALIYTIFIEISSILAHPFTILRQVEDPQSINRCIHLATLIPLSCPLSFCIVVLVLEYQSSTGLGC